jgi:chemotaxis protein methyltransferase CheR
MEKEAILSFFAKFIESELGIIYAEHNYFQLQNRLEEIAKLLNFDGIEDLYAQAQQKISGEFRQLLLDVATNNETSFFRDPKLFTAIESLLLSQFKGQNKRPQRLSIWSAASSSGQEALSTAMLLAEFNEKSGENIQFSISGTDISERVLNRAKTGQYSQLEVQRGLSAPLLNKYFKKNDQERWQVNPDLLKQISYSLLNLKDPFNFPNRFDLILCRNVLIYQSVPAKIEILRKLSDSLIPAGHLVLGSGESLLGLSDDYEQIAAEGAVLYRKKLKQ